VHQIFVVSRWFFDTDKSCCTFILPWLYFPRKSFRLISTESSPVKIILIAQKLGSNLLFDTCAAGIFSKTNYVCIYWNWSSIKLPILNTKKNTNYYLEFTLSSISVVVVWFYYPVILCSHFCTRMAPKWLSSLASSRNSKKRVCVFCCFLFKDNIVIAQYAKPVFFQGWGWWRIFYHWRL
jgi:hypothetical protein